MARLEGAYEQVSQRKIDLRFDALDRKIDALETKLDQRITGLEAAMDQRFMWLVGLFATSWATTIAAIYLHH